MIARLLVLGLATTACVSQSQGCTPGVELPQGYCGDTPTLCCSQ